MEPALKLLEKLAVFRGWSLELHDGLIGGAAIDHCGTPLPLVTLELCRAADAVLLGSVGGPRWDRLPVKQRPEIGGLLALRKELSLFANLRPVRLYPALRHLAPLKDERIGPDGLDILTVRELSGDVYYGEPRGLCEHEGFDTMRYSAGEVRRVAHTAFQAARKRRRRVTSVDKANVLNASILWRRVVSEVALAYPDVALDHMYVDNAAMQLTLQPMQFDVILTGNLFGDILSDASAALAGSLGLLPSASLGTMGIHLYEPAGGSAPDIAGKGVANPLAQILSVGLMAEHSFGDTQAADAVSRAVKGAISDGCLTVDLARSASSLSTREMGRAVIDRLGM
jgi:3-isopropylmalate dehydrogenase